MPSVPHTFVLFQYDGLSHLQTYIDASSVEQHLLDRIENANDSLYYCIYKYRTNTFHFNSTQEAQTYILHKVIKGKKNSGFFPFSPYEVAHKFENAYGWYYETALP